jgi:hypothetical protein
MTSNEKDTGTYGIGEEKVRVEKLETPKDLRVPSKTIPSEKPAHKGK